MFGRAVVGTVEANFAMLGHAHPQIDLLLSRWVRRARFYVLLCVRRRWHLHTSDAFRFCCGPSPRAHVFLA